MKQKIILLGSLGSIGQQSLKIIKSTKDAELIGISINKNTRNLKEILAMFPTIKFIISYNPIENIKIKTYKYNELGKIIDKYRPNKIINAISGIYGIEPTLTCLQKNVKLCLANKESILLAGHIIKKNYPNAFGTKILPIDSEITALLQCLANRSKKHIAYAYITMSGGAFRDLDLPNLKDVSYEDALKHPVWSMGSKITIDSASLMNKIFEVMEAYYYFDVPIKNIHVLLHYEAFMHAGIQFKDGSIVLSCYPPSMEIAISQAISESYQSIFPDKMEPIINSSTKLCFKPINEYQKRVLRLLAILEKNILLTIPFCIVDEILVEKFKTKKISFLNIIEAIEKALTKYLNLNFSNIDSLDKIYKLKNEIFTDLKD